MRISFENVMSDITSKFYKIKQSDYLSQGKYSIIDQGVEFIAGFTDDDNLVNMTDLPVIIFGDHTKIIKYIDFPIALGADGVKVLQTKSKDQFTKFIYYYLKSIKLPDAGYSRHFKYLKENKIPLPPLQEQIRIADILSRTESLIAKRKESIRLLDDLVKSVFLDMFGDPVRNEKGWKKIPFGDVSDSRLGKMLDKKFITGNNLKKYLGNSNVQWFSFDLSELLEMDFTPDEQKKYSLEKDDLLMCEGGEVGRCAIWQGELEDCYFQKALHRVRVKKDEMNVVFVAHLFWFLAHYNGFRGFSSEATIAHLTGEKLKMIPVIHPPVELQNKFASVVEKVETTKVKYRESLSELNALYGSLSQRAFRGEL